MMDNRYVTTQRWHSSVAHGIEEYAALCNLSFAAAAEQLCLEGLAAAYVRLGIDPEPAAMAGDLLRILGSSWQNELSGKEQDAVEVAREVVGRIAEIRSRESRDVQRPDLHRRRNVPG